MRLRFALLAVAMTAMAIAPARVADAACAPTDTVCLQLQDAKQSQATAVTRLQGIQQSLADAQTKGIQTMAVVDQLKSQIASQQAKIAQTQTRLATTTRQIQVTEAEITSQEANLQVREALLARRIRVIDQHSSTDYMELFVTSRSFTELVDRIVLAQTIVQSDQRLVESLRQQRDQIKRLRQQLQDEHDQEAAMLAQQVAQQTQLEQTRATQQQALDYYNQLGAQLEAQRKQAEAQKAQIDAQVAQLQAQYDAEARSLGGGTGRFAWPERGPITQQFGCTDFLLEPYDPNCPTLHFHSGIDIGAPFGTVVGAADNGVVSLVNFDCCVGYGNYVVITHGNGYSTLYGHLSAINVSVNQPVQRGQQIGAEGSTGFSTGPHLHFEIRLNGAYQNPLSYLP
ncbi:MAG TPA: peptidoglycan DD-metalloendopeptidase family protein [Terriglobales bacterium]|nr:peptidoglycan DD-metalloendopeptidase family protein [Terriglobales bacterium]